MKKVKRKRPQWHERLKLLLGEDAPLWAKSVPSYSAA
jgi:hypothetical protein